MQRIAPTDGSALRRRIRRRGIVWLLIAPAPILIGICLLTAWWFLPQWTEQYAREGTVQAAVAQGPEGQFDLLPSTPLTC